MAKTDQELLDETCDAISAIISGRASEVREGSQSFTTHDPVKLYRIKESLERKIAAQSGTVFRPTVEVNQ